MNTGIDRALSMKLDPIRVSPMEHEKIMMNIKEYSKANETLEPSESGL